MNALVCVKQVTIVDDEVVLAADGRDLDPDACEGGLNEWDAVAVEEALRLREAHGGSVTLITYGPERAEAALRRGLAMGADRALRIDGRALDPYTIAAGLQKAAATLQPDLILCGAQSSDSAQASTGTALAGLLDVTCVALAKSIQVDPATLTAVIDRELEGGIVERLRLRLPTVITVQTGTNEPRYANLRAIKTAEREPIDILAAPEIDPAYRVRQMFLPARAGTAATLGADLQQAAAKLAELVQERLR